MNPATIIGKALQSHTFKMFSNSPQYFSKKEQFQFLKKSSMPKVLNIQIPKKITVVQKIFKTSFIIFVLFCSLEFNLENFDKI